MSLIIAGTISMKKLSGNTWFYKCKNNIKSTWQPKSMRSFNKLPVNTA
jgi:hypothetical protein